MSFNSVDFFLFLPVVVVLYHASPGRIRWIVLLAASYVFYASWNARHLWLLLASTLIAYGAARLIDAARTQSRRRIVLAGGVAACLGLLFWYKYAEFARASANTLLHALDLPPLPFGPVEVGLPVGISFFTFQALAYIVDIYRRLVPVERHLGHFALFKAFFPQLVAGPIERPTTLLPQLKVAAPFEAEKARDGLALILWGLFKKVAIADNVAPFVDTVYADPSSHPGPILVAATVAFAIQIYGDFSGYTDIARGAAKLFGIELMLNFRRPYLATSVREFWHRWHISLSTWFRDYLYIPLGGRRVGVPRWLFNLFLTFVISGLWHGANWTFLAWGALHGLYVVAGWLTDPWRARARRALHIDDTSIAWRTIRIATTFALIVVAWVFFRAHSIADAFIVLSGMASGWGGLDPSVIAAGFASVGGGKLPIATALAGFILVHGMEAALASSRHGDRLRHAPRPLRWMGYLALTYWIVLLGNWSSSSFIYFRF